MKCKDFFSRIDPYLDGTLSCSEEKDFLTHLNQCPGCEAQLELAREALSLTQGFAASAPDFITPAVRRIQRNKRLQKRRWLGLGGIAAALLLICCAALLSQMGMSGMSDKSAAPQSVPDRAQQENAVAGGSVPAEKPGIFGSQETERVENEKSSQRDWGQALCLDVKQAEQLFLLLSEAQRQRLVPGEGGSYLPLLGQEEELLPLLQKCGIDVAKGEYSSIFLPDLQP